MDASPVDNEREAYRWREKLSEIERKRSGFQDLAVEGFMTKEELRSKLQELKVAREVAERELLLLESRADRFSALERDAEALLGDYEKVCAEELDHLSPGERREVYRLLDLTVKASPDGTLEATGSLNARFSKVRSRSRSTFQPAKKDLASAAASTVRFKRVFSQEQGCWSDPEMALG